MAVTEARSVLTMIHYAYFGIKDSRLGLVVTEARSVLSMINAVPILVLKTVGWVWL